jgi:hypothetical protein
MAVEKATYPKLLGLEESQKRAEALIAEAKAQLAPWGDKAILRESERARARARARKRERERKKRRPSERARASERASERIRNDAYRFFS